MILQPVVEKQCRVCKVVILIISTLATTNANKLFNEGNCNSFVNICMDISFSGEEKMLNIWNHEQWTEGCMCCAFVSGCCLHCDVCNICLCRFIVIDNSCIFCKAIFVKCHDIPCSSQCTDVKIPNQPIPLSWMIILLKYKLQKEQPNIKSTKF